MKHGLLLSSALLLAGATQAQITITQSNFPATTASVDRFQAADINGLTRPTTGANQTWNYSGATLTGTATQKAYVAPPANSSFSTATRAYNYQFSFGPQAVNGVQYQALTANGLLDLGFALPLQRISLRSLTLGANDSLIIPAQSHPYNSTLVKFPLTAGTVQTSTFRTYSDGLLTVSLLSLNRTPMRLVQRVTRVDSVAGWGTMRVPAISSGSTAAIPVIMRRTRYIEVDSVYQNGQPASPFLLAVLGITQGQVNTSFYYSFFRENSGQPLAEFDFTNSTFQTLTTAAFSRETNLVASTRAGLAAQVGGLLAFPKPTTDGRLTISLGNGRQQPVQLTVRDLLGRTLRTAPATTGQPTEVLAGLSAGTYLIDVQDRTGASSTVKVTVQ